MRADPAGSGDDGARGAGGAPLLPGEQVLWRGRSGPPPWRRTAAQLLGPMVAGPAVLVTWTAMGTPSGFRAFGVVWFSLFWLLSIGGLMATARRRRATVLLVTDRRALSWRGPRHLREVPLSTALFRVDRRREPGIGTISWTTNGAPTARWGPGRRVQLSGGLGDGFRVLGLIDGPTTAEPMFRDVVDLDGLLRAVTLARRGLGVAPAFEGPLPDLRAAGAEGVRFSFNPPPGWARPPDGWAPEAAWRPDPTWPPAPDGWPLFVWTGPHDDRPPVRPPGFADRPIGGILDRVFTFTSGLALSYTAVVAGLRLVSHHWLLGPATFVPAFVSVFPLWFWVVALKNPETRRSPSGQPRARPPWVSAPPLRPVRGPTSTASRALVLLVEVAAVVTGVLCLMLLRQPGAIPHGHDSPPPVALFLTAALVFHTAGLVTVLKDLARRHLIRKVGGTFPWL